MPLNQSEVLGQMFKAVKNGTTSATGTGTGSTSLASFIVTNVYDTERNHGDNRTVLLAAIAQAVAHASAAI